MPPVGARARSGALNRQARAARANTVKEEHMTKTGRVAVLAFSGVVMVALGAEGIPVPWAKGVAKRKVSLFVEGTGCAHDIEPKPVKLKTEKEKQGALGWRIENGCGIARKVLLCVYDAQGKLANPFDTCTSVPPGLRVAASFTLAASGGKAEIDCPAKTEGNYLAVWLVGDEVKGAGCPTTPPKERAMPIGEKTFTHRLAVEIVP
jgi:hypothetical protein